MHPLVQKALDGDISPHALTAAERTEFDAAEAQIQALLRAVPVEPLPDLAPAVLAWVQRESPGARAPVRGPLPAALPPAPSTRRPTVADWLWRPRSIAITWRPAYTLAAAALCAVVFAADSLRSRSIDVARAPQQAFAQFVLKAPSASHVALAGDFSGWQPVHVMTRSESGIWTIVVPLDPGVHDYAFVVDGERWIPDPAAPQVNDGFGGVNSRVAVLPPDGGRS